MDIETIRENGESAGTTPPLARLVRPVRSPIPQACPAGIFRTSLPNEAWLGSMLHHPVTAESEDQDLGTPLNINGLL